MVEANFIHYDSKYIYIPKIFNVYTGGMDEDWLLDRFIHYKLPKLGSLIKEQIGELKEILPEYIEIELIHKSLSDINFPLREIRNLGYYNTIMIFDKKREIKTINEIYYFFIKGKYVSGNLDYYIKKDKNNSRFDEALIYKVVDILEEIYSQFCDKYIAKTNFRTGEIYYDRIE